MASSRSQAYAKRRRQAQKRRQQDTEQLQVESLEPRVLLAGNTSTEVAQIVSVVPQPITRNGSTLAQARNQIDVYFNDVDLIDSSASAENPALYQLIYTNDTITNTDDTLINPIAVNYNPSANKAVLTFSNSISALGGDGAFRLRINTRQGLQTEPLELNEATINQVTPDDGSSTDAGSSFATAASVTGASISGDRLTGAITIDGTIEPKELRVAFPGSDLEPGMRDNPADAHYVPILEDQLESDNVDGITAIPYNFRPVYGTDPNGNQLRNAITPTQKDRAREVFDVYGSLLGVSFYETADEGFTIVTGDLRGAATAVNPTYILDLATQWDDSVGGTWYVEAMRGIGQLLGMGTTPEASGSSVTTNLGAGTLTPASGFILPVGEPLATDLPTQFGLQVEPIFPGDASIVIGQHLWRPDSQDIDLYRFQLSGGGRFSAETIAERLSDSSLLDTMLTLFDSSGKVIASNDDYFSEDSLIDLRLNSGTYYIGVSASGNSAYNPVIEDTGLNGTSEGAYRLRLDFRATSTESLIARSGTALDGDGDGQAGGVFNYWFEANDPERTIYVDKSATSGGDGSLSSPYNEVDRALDAAVDGRDIVRIVGNGGADGDITTLGDNLPYEIGFDNFGQLVDGGALVVPRDVTVMVDAGAIFKMRRSYVQVGTSTTNVDRSGAALQILGTPVSDVIFTSREDESIGVDNQLLSTTPEPGEWGGIIYKNDLDRANFKSNPDGTPRDFEGKGIFLNHINNADLRYGGGNVTIDSVQQTVNPIHLIDARPTISYNDITFSADAAISANPDSFEESRFHAIDSLEIDYQETPFTSSYQRIGPDIQGNLLADNTTNALSIRINTLAGGQLERLTVSGRFDDTDIVHVIKENLIIGSTPGGPIQSLADGRLIARQDGQLVIDPGIIIKMDGTRIEALVSAQLIAEGDEGNPIIITSISDDTYGGVTEQVRQPRPGDWGGIYVGQESRLSIDHAIIAYGGGVARIPGSSAAFNTIEIHQAEAARITNSKIQHSAFGLGGIAEPRRAGRGTHDAGAIFVRGAQPIIVGNEITGTEGTEAGVISIDPNSLNATERVDYGRSRGLQNRFVSYDDNQGPLIRNNVIDDNSVNGMVVRPGVISTETVWDDTDIVHVMYGEIVVPNVFSAGGVRLESSPSESLVIKLDGQDAGFTASGTPLDIDDRIGGILNVVGQPGKPVVMTSLADDSVGAGLGLDGSAQTDTDQGFFTRPSRTNEPGSFQIDINYGPVIRSHPDIMAGVERAARLWERLIEDPITVTIDFELDSLAQDNAPDGREPGTFAIPNEFDPGGGAAYIVLEETTTLPFDEIVSTIKKDAREHEAFVEDIPNLASINVAFPPAPQDPFLLNEEIRINTANYKALYGDSASDILTVPSAFDANEARDGSVLINEGALGFLGVDLSPVFYDFDLSDGLQQGKFDFVGMMSGAIGQILGFRSSIEDVRFALLNPGTSRDIAITPMDLFRIGPGEGQTNFGDAARALNPALQTHVFYDGGIFDPLDLPKELRLKNGDIPLLADDLLNEFVNVEGDGITTSYEHYTNLNNVYLGVGGQAVFESDFEYYITDQDRAVFDLIGYDVVGGPIAGDWRGVELKTFANDRNVAVINEYEDVGDREGSNRVPSEAQYVGAIAKEAKDADENQRIGIRVNGFINNPADVDVYSFDAQAGTELWIDIDRTSQALDTVVELVDANGITLARSDNSLAETRGEEFRFESPVVPTFNMDKSPFLSVDHYSTNERDAGMRLVIPGNTASDALSTYFIRVRSAGRNLNLLGGGLTTGRYELQIRTQELDELPGTSIQFADIRYATDGVRVSGLPRHSPLTGEVIEDESANDTYALSGAADDFLAFGNLPLRVDQIYAGQEEDRYRVLGTTLPAFPQPQYVGNVQTTDRGAIAISGSLEPLASFVDVDHYTFSLSSPANLMFDVDYADGLGRADTSIYIYTANYTLLGEFEPFVGELLYSSDDGGDRDDLPAPFQDADLDDLSRGSVGTLDPILGPVSLPPGDFILSIAPNSVRVPFTSDQFSSKLPDNPFLRAEPISTLRRIADESFDGPALIEPEIPVLIDANGIVPLSLADVPLFVSAPGGTGTDIFTVDTFQGGMETHVGTLQRLPEDLGGPVGDLPDQLFVNDIVLAERQLPPGAVTEKVEELLFGFTQEANDNLSGNYLAISPATALAQRLILPDASTLEDLEIEFPENCREGDDCIVTYRLDPEADPEDPEAELQIVPEAGEGVQFEALTLRNLGPRQYEGFAVGHRGDPGIDNILYFYDHLTGNALSDPGETREDPPATPASPEEAEVFGFSNVVERGVLFTDGDRAPLSTTVIENADTALIVTAATDDDGQPLITDGTTLSVDENGTVTVYEFDTTDDFLVAADPLNGVYLTDGAQFQVGDTIYEIETGAVISVDDITAIGDGDTIAIGDLRGNAPVLFVEMDSDGAVGPGRVPMELIGLETEADVATRLAEVINAQTSFSAVATVVGNRISLDYDNGVIVSSAGIEVSGGGGVTDETVVAVSIEEYATTKEVVAAIANVVGDVVVSGNRMGFNQATTDLTTDTNGVFTSLNGGLGVSGTNVAIPFSIDFDRSQIAEAISAAIGTGTAYDGVVTLPTGGDFTFDDGGNFEIEGQSPGGLITGIAFVGGSMYGVSDRGGLYRINGIDAPQGASADYLEQSAQLLGTRFSGLTVGPADVGNGVYANMLFATDSSGGLHAFDVNGIPQPVFADGATSISTGISNANGLQFSTAQSNLWNFSDQRANDPGHGGGNSLRFGEVERGRNIDLPGGVQGSVFSNEIDLSTYTAQDLPTLYFNYFMTAEENEQKTDAFRVFVSDDSEGAAAKGTWHLLATSDETPRNFDNDPDDPIEIDVQTLFNNSFQDVPSYVREGDDINLTPIDPDVRLPANGQRDTFPLQERDEDNPPPFDPARLPDGFQPFEEPQDWLAFPEFDETQGVWRQARVDLSDFAGSDSLRLRFDFSTAASFDLGRLGGVELKTIAASKLDDGETLTVDGVTFEIDFGVSVSVPSGPAIIDGEVVYLLDDTGVGHRFQFTTDGTVPEGVIPVVFEPLGTGSTTEVIAASFADAINTTAADLGVDFSATIVGNELKLTGIDNVFVDLGSRFDVEGAGLAKGVADGNVPIEVDQTMTADQVASVVAAAFVEELGAGIDANYVVTGNVIRLYGNDISDPGPFGLATSLKGDEWGTFTSAFGDPAYRGLENEYRYYEMEEGDAEVNPRVLPFALPDPEADEDEFPLDFSVQFEGVYVDDIIIGFKTRGEAVTNERPQHFFSPDWIDLSDDPEGFGRIPLVPDVFSYAPQPTVLEPGGLTDGEYRLEIRLATQEDVLLNQLDRTVENITLIAPPGIQVFDGKVFELNDGRQTVVFEYNDVALDDGVNPDHVAVNFSVADTEADMAVRIRDAINDSPLSITATTGDGSTERGIVTTSSSRINLIGNALVIDLEAPNGIESVKSTFAGSGNRNRDQGQLIITQSRISHSEGHGIIVEDSPRDLPSYLWSDPFKTELHAQFANGDYTPQPGPAQNLREINENSVTTGVVVSNNVIAFNGEGGVKYGGDPNGYVMVAPTGGDPPTSNVEVWDGLRFSVTDNNGLTQTFEFHDLSTSGGPRAPRRSGPSDDVGANDWEYGNVPIMFARSDYVTAPSECIYMVVIPCEDRYLLGAEVGMADRLQQAFERSNLDVNVFRGKGHEIFIEGVREILWRPRDARAYEESSPDGGAWAGLFSFVTQASVGQAPFGRIVNNTIVGLGGEFTDSRVDSVAPLPTSPTTESSIDRVVNDFQDIGIEIGDNADPTLLNNIIVNFEVGVAVDFTAIDTVRGGLVFQANQQQTQNTNVGDFALQLDNDEPLFVDLLNGNFYPAQGSRIIDSSIDSLEERPELLRIKSPLGINPSPVLTPIRDVLGQLREDDPSIEPQEGIGRNAFKDRGATDRVDFFGPTVILQNPRDNDSNGLDLDPASTSVALSALVGLNNFELAFQDSSQLGGTLDGTGVDPFSVAGDAVLVFQDDELLANGDDYTLSFDNTNSVLRIIPTSGSWPAGRTYLIRLDGVQDLAGNPVRDNQIGGGVEFTITTLLGTDYGDAPAEYPSASHDIAVGLFLGNSVTPDAGSQPDAAASADSGDDGVLLPDEFLRNEPNTVTVQASADGILDAWFDFNNNRVFDTSERVFAGVNLTAGANELTVNLPQATAGGELFARFRFSSDGIATPGGLAADGEVEDYVISVDGGAIWQNLNNPFDVDNDGFLAPRDYLLISQEIRKSLASDPVTKKLDDPFVAPNTPSSIGFVDVTGDGFVSPSDLLAVVTAINEAGASGEPPELDAAMVAAVSTSVTVDPIGEILQNPVVELPVATAPAAQVLDEVFTFEDNDKLALELATAHNADSADDVFADSDWLADDSDL